MTLLHWGWYQHALILDTVEYHRYGDGDRGRPRALPRLRGRVPAGRAARVRHARRSASRASRCYNREFQVLMALCGVGSLAAMSRGAARARCLGRADGGGARLLRARAARARLGDPLPLRPLAGGADGRRARGGARAAGAARVRGARARRRGEGVPGGSCSRRRSPTSGARAAGARRCSASASRAAVVAAASSSRSSRSRRTASGTASSGRRRGRCRSRASARRCCSPRTTSAGSG